jgi:hypothetical protein
VQKKEKNKVFTSIIFFKNIFLEKTMSSVGLNITAQQTQLLELYSENPTRKVLQESVDECVEGSNKVVKLFVKFTSGVFIMAGGIAGSMIGANVGTSVGAFYPVIGPRIGGIAGGALGGVAGASIGDALSRRTITIIISRTSCFADWKRNALKDNLYPLFQEILDENVFDGLKCPITHELPIVPVKTPCDHVYEKEDIEHWLNSRKPEGRCCVLGCVTVFTARDLKYSQPHMRKIINAARDRIEQLKVLNDRNSQSLSEGFRAISKDANNVSNGVFSGIMDHEAKTAFSAGMSLEDFQEASKRTFMKLKSIELD